MKLHFQKEVLLLASWSLIAKKANAVYLDGLQRLYRLDGNANADWSDISSADLSYYPLSGNGISFVSDSPYPIGPPRQVINFTGKGRVQGTTQGLPGGSSSRTMVGWFKINAGNTGDPWGYGRVNNCKEAFYIDFNTGSIVYFDIWGTDERINPIIQYPANDVWYHLAISWDGTRYKAYVNGALEKEGAPSEHPETVVHPAESQVSIGDAPLRQQYFTGRVADFAIFDRALTLDEVKSIYDDPNGLEGTVGPPTGAPVLPFPTEAPVPLTTPSPTITLTYPTPFPTEAPVPLTTPSPTITKAGNNQWFIDNIGDAIEEATSADTILISLPMNATNQDIGARVFHEDCFTPFDNSNYFIADTTSKTSTQPDGYVQFNTTLVMNITAINGTVHWTEFTDGTRGGYVKACVETYLNFTDNLNLDNDDVTQKVGDIKNNVLNISVSLNADYEVDGINVDRETADRQDVNTDYSEFITAYECIESDPYSVRTSSDPYTQGDEITICVSDESSGIVQVEEFVNLVVAQDGNTPYNFILGTLYNPEITTPICRDGATDSERRVCYAKIRALARFFQSADPADLTISGSMYVVRDGGRRVRRDLHMTLPDSKKSSEEHHALAVSGRRAEEEIEGSGEFEVKVSLGSTDATSAASGRMIGSGVAGLVVSMSVGVVGAALMA